MPELPEVESLAAFLRAHATGHAVARADAASFSVLKTFDPPLSALTGQVIAEVGLARQVPGPVYRPRPAPDHAPGPGGLAALAR